VTTLRFAPRLLFLSADPQRVRAQLAGTAATLPSAAPLRDDVSTDEISPLPAMVHFDATLGRYPYTGFKTAGVQPVIAESFERIYRQNADNVGLLTSTDFSLIERIARGEAIDLDELLAGR